MSTKTFFITHNFWREFSSAYKKQKYILKIIVTLKIATLFLKIVTMQLYVTFSSTYWSMSGALIVGDFNIHIDNRSYK